MDFYTEEGDRSSLQNEIEVNPPEGYIGTVMMPVTPVTEKAGSMAYATVTADSTAQTGRVAGAAPNATQISNSAHAWACTEIIDRAAITPDEAKQIGSMEAADKIGFRWAMRQVLAAREALIAAVILGDADDTFDAAKIRTDVQTAKQTVRQYPGRTVLAASTYTLNAMVQNIAAQAGIGDAFARIVTGVNAAEAAMGLSFEAWKRGLAMFLGVDDVLAGDDAVWNAGTCAGKFSLVKVDNTNDPLSHKYIPVLGKTITFLPQNTKGWELSGVADRTLINNFYDAKMWIDVETYNAAAVYTFSGVAA
jgi:hypothetical protein